MDADKLQQIQEYARAIAALLYDETALEQLTTLEGIEAAVRGHILEHISPEVGHFLWQQPVAQVVGADGNSRASWEQLPSAKTRQRYSKSQPGAD